ncbi:MAG: DUF5696 domain-containing protein [Candidatus Izemoplasmataceae bacterium]
MKKPIKTKALYQRPKTPIDYFTWNIFRRAFYSLKVGIIEKIHNYKFPKSTVIALGSITLFIGVLFWIISSNILVVKQRAEYDMTDFIHASELSNTNVVLSNNRFEFRFDETTTHFELFDSVTLYTWRSNVSEADTFPNITPASLNRQQNTLVAYYRDLSGNIRPLNSYDFSISRNQYYVRYGDNSVEVHYQIGNMDIDYTDLPQRLSKERFETLILSHLDPEADRVDYRFLENAYTFVTEQQVNALRNASNFSQNAIERIHRIVFEMTPYTKEDMVIDHQEQGVDLVDNKPLIGVSVLYTLTEDGFDVKIINESIQEKSLYPLVNIDLLPNFAEASTLNEGYLFVPDGSGALIELNNGKSNREYSQRLYGMDYGKVQLSKPTSQELTALPVFGMKKDQQAYIAIITEGASMASVNARVSGASDSYNRVFATFHYMERDRIRIPGVTSNDPSSLYRTVWTRFYSQSDYEVSYRFTDTENSTYVGMADLYRDYLIDLGLTRKTQSEGLSMNVTLLAGYTKTNHFLGVPYETVESLTSTEEVMKIIEALQAENVDHINIIYQGWLNGGIDHHLPSRIKYHRVIGNRSAMNALLLFGDNHNVAIYPEVTFLTPTTDERLNMRNDVARSISGNLLENYGFNHATLLPDRNSRAHYILNPSSLEGVVESFLNDYNRLNTSTLALNDLGSMMYGSYNNQDFYFRYQTEAIINEALLQITESHSDIMIRNPLALALPHASKIIDLPVKGTEFNIIDMSIPFYQLVLSDLVDYAGQSFNIYDQQSMMWHKLKAIETGSHLNFTWTYSDTYDLMHTEFNRYYSTHYINWFDEAVSMYKEVDGLNIHEARLIQHEILERDIIKVTYSNGVEIVINYKTTSTMYQSTLIPAMDYRVIKGAN